MRLVIGLILCVGVGLMMPPNTPWYIGVASGAVLMWATLYTFRGKKQEPKEDG